MARLARIGARPPSLDLAESRASVTVVLIAIVAAFARVQHTVATISWRDDRIELRRIPQQY
jgi:hypothetical protein